MAGIKLGHPGRNGLSSGDIVYSCGTDARTEERFVSNAQNFEDVILFRALFAVENGFYIDVGAGNPDIESVTRSFYERGWSGINIEPAEEAWRRIRERRPRDINLRSAAGNKIGRRPFFLVDGGGGLSTLCEEIAKAHSSSGHSLDQIDCPIVTLSRVCEDHVARPIHFLKIDVEGAEREVLEGADFDRYRPWIILVEATYPNSAVPSHGKWEALLDAGRYRFAYFDGLNRFYVAEEMWERLGAALQSPPNVFDNFIRAYEEDAISRAASAEQRAAEAEQRTVEAEQEASSAMERAAGAEMAVIEAEANAKNAISRAASAEQRTVEAEQAVSSALERAAIAVTEAEANAKNAISRTASAEQRAVEAEQAVSSALERATIAVTEAEAKFGAALDEVARARAERDIYEQEMFEVNRHAAWVSQERQNLIWRIAEVERDRDNRIAEIQQERQHLIWRIAEAEREIDRNKEWIRAMYSSTSWKFARPVRAARKFVNLVLVRR